MKRLFLTAVFLVSCTATSQAVLIPTPITHSAYADGTGYFASSLTPDSSSIIQPGDALAHAFSLSQSYYVTDAFGRMQLTDMDASLEEVGTLNLVLYRGSLDIEARGGVVPDTSQTVYEQLFNVPEEPELNFHGVSGMDVNLSPGTYWLAFEQNDFKGFVGPDIALYGHSVPEPAGVLLFSGGLLGFYARRRKR